MVFEVNFCTKNEKGDFNTIHSEVILSEGVASCQLIANEIAQTLKVDNIKIFIGDFFE
ncbi:hypothetical protein GLV98_12360 [Halobacillus litoralis]|uniref:Uncharacterized protein n=1 Tax=Halobacillus litoralis TaxID=45668 RepID=A0A845E5X9_9BACI|nr:hypothetical protein [Halobacillus litoralis]MYL50282.1 hypothetical protein [Halobacillus litoralis]